MKVLLGLTGSVASTLAPKMICKLIEAGHTVGVVITDKVYAFVDEYALCTAGAKICYNDFHETHWNIPTANGIVVSSEYKKGYDVLHVKLCSEYDVLLIAPLTANTFSKMMNGICDNLLTSVLMGWHPYKKIVIAPAMNTHMWDKISSMYSEILPKNVVMVGPIVKELACGVTGMGGMADISDIISELREPIWHIPLRSFVVPMDSHPGSFGVTRKDGRHTGVDLYCNNGDEVMAVEDGVVVCVEHFTGEWDNSPWWNNTDCILVEGSSGVVCYGEITTTLKVGDKVLRGQVIANVVQVIKGKHHPEIPHWQPSMLHIEWYNHGVRQPSEKFTSDLRDPTHKLLNTYHQHKGSWFKTHGITLDS